MSGDSGSGTDVWNDILHTVTLGFLGEASEEVAALPFKIKDGVLPFPLEAEVACQPQPLPELGEGAIWDERSGRLLFLDILGSRLFRFDPKQPADLEEHSLAEFSSAVSSVVPLSDSCDKTGDVVGVTLREGFATYNFRRKQLTSLPNNPDVAERERFNDGKVDTKGRYWAGTIARDSSDTPVYQGALYRRDLNGSVVKVLEDVAVSNGLSWDKDGTMYFTDTWAGTVDKLSYDMESGEVSGRTPCIEGFDFDTTGLPDGHCMDAEGMLWVACFNGGRVLRFDPKTGELLAEVHLPAEAGLQVTSCTFGGDALKDLYITTAHEGTPVSELPPLAGALFIVSGEKLKELGGKPYGVPASRWFLPGAGKETTCCAAACAIQ